jgi:general secretion pathway protein N
MGRVTPFALLGIAAYAVFLVATLPASVLLDRAGKAQPGNFEVREAGGTAWRGSARLTLNTPGGPIDVDDVRWHWLPSRLLAARFAFDIKAASRGVEVHSIGARYVGGWEVRDLEARGEAARLATLLPWIVSWRPEGTIAIASPKLDTDGIEVRGTARVEWRNAAVALSEVKPLGSYRADIEAEGHAARVTVTTVSGALRIAGQGTLTPPTRFAFSGEARAVPESAVALAPLLDLLGPARADGARAIEWRVP